MEVHYSKEGRGKKLWAKNWDVEMGKRKEKGREDKKNDWNKTKNWKFQSEASDRERSKKKLKKGKGSG